MTNLPGIVVLLFPPELIRKKRKNEELIDTILKKEERKIEQNIIRSVLKVSFCITILPGSVSFAYYSVLTPKSGQTEDSTKFANKQTNST